MAPVGFARRGAEQGREGGDQLTVAGAGRPADRSGELVLQGVHDADCGLDAALTARPATGLEHLLSSCAATDRRVAVISALSERAVLATLRAHHLDRQVAAVAARPGPDLSLLGTTSAIERAADLIGAAVPTCLVVSGNTTQLWTARQVGAIGLGCAGGPDPRKHLAAYAPVVPRLATLSQALLNG